MEKLKSLKAEHTGELGEAVRRAFDLLNLHRLQSGVDCYGLGRKPWFNAQGTVIVLTDGGDFDFNVSAVPDVISVPTVLTSDFFRADQRAFAVVNSFPRLLGGPIEAGRESELQLQDFCELTGGCAFYPAAMNDMLKCVENILEKSYFMGVTVEFECLVPIPEGLAQFSPQYIRLPPLQPNQPPPTLWWPFPEDFHTSVEGVRLEPASSNIAQYTRMAHSKLVFSASDKKLALLQSFPIDKYELEVSAFTVFFLKNVKEGNCWPIHTRFNLPVKRFKEGKFVQSSNNEGRYIGFVRQSANRTGVVNLYVLPYNFPTLFTLLDELIVKSKGVVTQQWRVQFESYLRNLPYYYIAPLRSCLNHMGLQNVLSPQVEAYIPAPLVQNLKKLTMMAKGESERFETSLEEQRKQEAAKNPILKDDDLLSVSRGKVLSELAKLRSQFDPDVIEKRQFSEHKQGKPAIAVSEEGRFSLPIAVMGDYHERGANELREARDKSEKLKPLFGNPFFPIEKVTNRLKRDSLVLDEAEDLSLEEGGSGGRNKKRSPTRKQSPEYKSKMPSPPI